MQNLRCAHRNLTEEIIWVAHADQIVPTILGRPKHDIDSIKRQLRLGNQCAADVRRIRTDQKSLLEASLLGDMEGIVYAAAKIGSSLRETRAWRYIGSLFSDQASEICLCRGIGPVQS